jgi:hypothetical protein
VESVVTQIKDYPGFRFGLRSVVFDLFMEPWAPMFLSGYLVVDHNSMYVRDRLQSAPEGSEPERKRKQKWMLISKKSNYSSIKFHEEPEYYF